MKWTIRLAGLLVAIVTLAGAASAQSVATVERSGETEPRFDPTQIVFKPGVGKVGLALSVSGPEDYQFRQDYEPGVSPAFSVTDLKDGLYSYELRIVPALRSDESGGSVVGRVEASSSSQEMARQGDKRPQDAIVQSGHFRIKAGNLVLTDLVERGSETPFSELEMTRQTGLPDKDICHLDDLIVDGSLCVGIDCACGHSFGFDTIVLKENNLRIFFDDTSTAASFPRNDWRIVINDSANGGASYFGIEDSTGGRRVFSIEAGAPSHSLYVEDGGRVGFGTSSPVVDLHVKDGDTPTLRLEQDGSSGFAPQTWDVAGNEAGFFIRDATSGSKLVYRIRPGAPTSSIDIAADGDVGFGTGSPASVLHVSRAGLVLPRFESTDNNAVQVVMKSNSENRRIVATDGSDTNESQIVFKNNGTIDFLGPTGGDLNATISSSGLNVNGTISLNSSVIHPDFVFEPGYELPTIDEQATFMWTNSHLPAVGPGTYDAQGNALIDFGGKTLGILEELEKAHIYIEQLHATVKELQIEQHHATSIIADLQNRLEKLESGANE